MTDTKISGLTAASAAALTNQIPINEAGTSKRLTLAQVADLLGHYKATVASDHAISATTATEVTLTPTPTLQPGTYQFRMLLVVQSATATVSPMYGINFTGTLTKIKAFCYWNDSGGLGTGTGVADDVGTTAGQMMAGTTVSSASTTAPNMGHTGGVGTINADVLVAIEGMFICTTSGDFELWHGSETATSTTVKAGSSVILTRVA